MHWIKATRATDRTSIFLNLSQVVAMQRGDDKTLVWAIDTGCGTFEVDEAPEEILAKPPISPQGRLLLEGDAQSGMEAVQLEGMV